MDIDTEILKRYKEVALAAVAQWIEHWPVNRRVTSYIPSQGTCLGGRSHPQQGAARGNHTLTYLSSFSLASPLSQIK